MTKFAAAFTIFGAACSKGETSVGIGLTGAINAKGVITAICIGSTFFSQGYAIAHAEKISVFVRETNAITAFIGKRTAFTIFKTFFVGSGFKAAGNP